MKSTKYPIVEVTWNDHHGTTGGWMKLADIDCSPLPCVTVGVVIKEDKLGLSIAGSYYQQDGFEPCYSSVSYILKADVIKRRKL